MLGAVVFLLSLGTVLCYEARYVNLFKIERPSYQPLGQFRYKACNTTRVPLYIRTLNVSPEPLQPGTKAEWSADVEVSQTIAGNIDYNLQLLYKLEGSQDYVDLCSYTHKGYRGGQRLLDEHFQNIWAATAALSSIARRHCLNNLTGVRRLRPHPIIRPCYRLQLLYKLEGSQEYVDICSYTPKGYCGGPDVCGRLAKKVPTCPATVVKAGFNCRCPFKQGSYKFPATPFTVPVGMGKMPGTFRWILKLLDQDGTQLMCAQADFCVERC